MKSESKSESTKLSVPSPNSRSHYWRWMLAALMLILAVASVMLFSNDEMQPEEVRNLKPTTNQTSVSIAAWPVIEVKSIQASPFQPQLSAQLRINGTEQRAQVGQQLRDNLFVKSIDANGVNLLHHQQLRRYELPAARSSATNIRTNEDKPLKATITLLSNEFRSTPKGLEVYSATQQGLSASLGLQNGDLITQINGERVTQPEDILRLLKNYHPKQVLEFVGLHQGQVTRWVYQAQADD